MKKFLILASIMLLPGTAYAQCEFKRVKNMILNEAHLYKNNPAKVCEAALGINYCVAGNPSAKGFIKVLEGWRFLNKITQNEYNYLISYMSKN